MTPNLEFSQGVHGVSTGRSYGIIDMFHLVEVARAASIVGPKLLSATEYTALIDCFKSYIHWMKTREKALRRRRR
jgi:hypothetical protein